MMESDDRHEHNVLVFPTLEAAIAQAQGLLANFVSDISLSSKIDLVFGTQVDSSAAKSLITELAVEDSTALPKIEVRSASEINGANAAFAGASYTIYLSWEFLTENAGNLSLITAVLLEEIGHAIDFRLNTSDTPGDEGELFSDLARGVVLSDGELQRLKTEDDSAVVTIDGKTFQIEQANLNLGLVQGLSSRNDTLTWSYGSYGYYLDQDIFSFQISGTGGANNYVVVSGSSSYVDLFLQLADQYGNILKQSSIAGSNNEAISLQGLSSGTYYLKVGDIYSGQYIYPYSAAYTLIINAPPTWDQYDKRSLGVNNDYWYNATPIDTSNGVKQVSNLSIDNFNDVDWFKISIPQTSYELYKYYVWIDQFNPQEGDLAIALWNEYGYRVGVADAPNDNYEGIDLAGYAPGTYYVQVGSFKGHTNPSYRLTVSTPQAPKADSLDSSSPNDTSATASNLGSISGIYHRSALSLHSSTDLDWFKFNISQIGTLNNYIGITFDGNKGNLGIALYDAQGNFLGYSDNTYGNSESLSLSGKPKGDYYAVVYSYWGSIADYSLTINAPGTNSQVLADPFESNNTFNSATNLATKSGLASDKSLSGFYNWQGLSIETSDQDWFTFKLNADGTKENYIAIQFDTYQGDLDLKLYNASNQVLKEAKGLRNLELISLDGLTKDTSYYVQVIGNNGATNPNYTLYLNAPGDVGNDSQDKATSLGKISGTKTFDNLAIDSSSDVDWYRFIISGEGTQNNFVQIDFKDSLSDLDIKLYQNTNYSSSGNIDPNNPKSIQLVDKDSSEGVGDQEKISLVNLAQGEYFLKVYSYNNKAGSYTLTLNTPTNPTGDPCESNNSPTTATDLNQKYLQGKGQDLLVIDNPENPLSIHQNGDIDWYKFTLDKDALNDDYVAINFDHKVGDLELELYDSTGTTKLGSSYGVAKEQKISLKGKKSGSYLLKVFEYNGKTSPQYSLVIDAPLAAPGQTGTSPLTADSYEPNNTRLTASNLGNQSNVISNLSLHKTNNTTGSISPLQ